MPRRSGNRARASQPLPSRYCGLAVALSGLLAQCPPSVAQETVGEDVAPARIEMSMRDCIALARVTHEDSIIARQTIREAAAGVDEAEAARYPTVSADVTARTGETEARRTGAGGPTVIETEANQTDVSFSFAWTLFDSGRRQQLIRRARLIEQRSRFTALGRLRDLDYAVARAFIALERAEATLDVARETEALDAESLRAARLRRDIGDGSDIAVIQAEAQAALSAQQVISASNAVRTARVALLAAMGLAEDPGFVFLPEEPPLGIAPPPLQTCLETAYAARDDIAEIQRALDIARVDVKLADLGRRLSFEARADASADVSRDPVTTVWQLRFIAQMPLFDGGAARSRVRAAEAREIISEAQVTQALRQVWSDVTTAYADWESAVEGVAAAQAAEEAARRSQEQTEASYRAGASSYFDTVSARAQYARARQQLVDAKAQLVGALWALERAAPGILPTLHPLSGWDPDLGSPQPPGAPAEGVGNGAVPS